MPPSNDYNTYFCKVHKKTIYYFKTDEHIQGYFHCWDCVKEQNDARNKRSSSQGHLQEDGGSG